MTALQGGPGDPTGSTPRSVRLAIIVMLVAGAASLLQSVLVLTQWDTLVAENLVRSGPPTTITGIFLAMLGAEVGAGYGVVTGALGLVAWSGTAWATRRGRPWARAVATVLGCLAVLGFLLGLIPYWPATVRIPATVAPVAAVVAVVLLSRRDRALFSATRARPR